MSIRSPDSSRTTACTREPLMPTHAPTGSIRSSVDATAILDRVPGSRATARICTTPSAISGTSLSKSLSRKSGCVRESVTCGPFVDFSTESTNART